MDRQEVLELRGRVRELEDQLSAMRLSPVVEHPSPSWRVVPSPGSIHRPLSGEQAAASSSKVPMLEEEDLFQSTYYCAFLHS